MAEQILDGRGRGYLAEVDSDHRVHIYAITNTDEADANEEGRAFNINTGTVALTSDTAILYFKYTGTTELNITAIAVGLGVDSGSSTDIAAITVKRNPTSISAGSTVAINSNRNYGSSKALSCTATAGSDGATLTGGDDHLLLYQGFSGRLFASIDEVLTPDSSIGIEIALNGGSCNAYAALICHEHKDI